MRRISKIKLKLPRPRSRELDSLLLEKSKKSGGTHVLKKDKRSQSKKRKELEKELDYLNKEKG